MTTNRSMVLGVALLVLVTGRWTVNARMDMPPIVQNQDTFDQGKSSGGGTAGGAGGSGARNTDPSCGSDPGQCFGVVGMACDGTVPAQAATAITGFASLLGFPTEQLAVFLVGSAEVATTSTFFGCMANGGCHINAGSWLHDECCAMTANGSWCSTQSLVVDPTSTVPCNAEWNLAMDRTARGLSWIRFVDQCRVDRDGLVDFAEYCAPGGTIVGQGDDRFCCSRRTRRFSAVRDAARVIAQHAITFAGPVRVCTGPANPPAAAGASSTSGGSGSTGSPPRSCQTTADCRASEFCIAPSSGGAKRCMAA